MAVDLKAPKKYDASTSTMGLINILDLAVMIFSQFAPSIPLLQIEIGAA